MKLEKELREKDREYKLFCLCPTTWNAAIEVFEKKLEDRLKKNRAEGWISVAWEIRDILDELRKESK